MLSFLPLHHLHKANCALYSSQSAAPLYCIVSAVVFPCHPKDLIITVRHQNVSSKIVTESERKDLSDGGSSTQTQASASKVLESL